MKIGLGEMFILDHIQHFSFLIGMIFDSKEPLYQISRPPESRPDLMCFDLFGPDFSSLVARTIRLLTITLKRLHLALPNLVTFCFFFLLDTFWQKFNKIDSPWGLLQIFFNEMSRKNEHMIFFVLLQNQGNAGGYKFVPEKMFSGLKRLFFSGFARFQGVNIELRLLVPFWKEIL